MNDQEAMDKFEAFCRADQALRDAYDIESEDEATMPIDASEEQDWYSLSLGFFVAIGCSNAQAHKLACAARYDHQYWC